VRGDEQVREKISRMAGMSKRTPRSRKGFWKSRFASLIGAELKKKVREEKRGRKVEIRKDETKQTGRKGGSEQVRWEKECF